MNLHTNLDCCPGGVNDVLAAKLGLEHVEILHPMGTDRQGRPYGLVRMGTVPEQSLAGFASSRRFPAPASDSRMQENLCAKSQSAAAAAAARSMRS